MQSVANLPQCIIITTSKADVHTQADDGTMLFHEAQRRAVTLRVPVLMYRRKQRQYRQSGAATIIECPNAASLRVVRETLRKALASLNGLVVAD